MNHSGEANSIYDAVSYCMAHSEFYRRKFAAAGVDPLACVRDDRLGDIPFTEKRDLIEDQVSCPPYGSNLCVASSDIRRVHRTSGSTGRPLYVAMTQKDVDSTHLAGSRCFSCSGLRPGHTVAHCLNYCMWMGGLSDHMSLEATGATVVPYGVGHSRGLVDLIRSVGINAISCTPSYMSRLETIVRDELGCDPRDLGLKLGLFGGEPGIQNPHNRRNIEEVWGMRAMDANYGLADVLSMFGSECEFRDGLHFHGQGLLHVELIDPDSLAPVSINRGASGELVFTNLVRQAQPLIRYRSRDVVEIVAHEPCACGRAGFRFRVLGRSDDMLHVRGVNVFPSAVGNIISRYTAVFTGEYEIVLGAPPPLQRLPLRVEKKRGVGDESLRAAIIKLGDDVRSELSVSIDCEVVDDGALGRTEGKKARVIKSY